MFSSYIQLWQLNANRANSSSIFRIMWTYFIYLYSLSVSWMKILWPPFRKLWWRFRFLKKNLTIFEEISNMFIRFHQRNGASIINTNKVNQHCWGTLSNCYIKMGVITHPAILLSSGLPKSPLLKLLTYHRKQWHDLRWSMFIQNTPHLGNQTIYRWTTIR